jgi:hypothetical protein
LKEREIIFPKLVVAISLKALEFGGGGGGMEITIDFMRVFEA